MINALDYENFLKSSIRDSPTDRAQLDKYSRDFQDIQKWLESLIKGLERLIQGHQNKRQAILDFSISIIPPSDNILLDAQSIQPITDMIASLKDVNEHFIAQIQDSIIQECTNFIKNDCSAIKRIKSQYEKMREKFDTLLIRHQASSKTKDSLSYQEDAQNVYQAKLSYARETLSFALACKTFKFDFDAFFANIIKTFLNLQCDFYKENQDKLNGLVPCVNSWSNKLSESQISFKEYTVNLENFKLVLQDELSKQSDPLRKRTVQSKYTQKTTTKKGYLFKKIVNKIGAASFKKRYFVLENGRLYYQFLRKGIVYQIHSLNTLLCNIRANATEDRRFCIDIVHPERKMWTLQAETKNDYEEWIEALEYAKYHATSSNGPLPETPSKMDNFELNEDDEDPEELEVIFTVTSDSLLSQTSSMLRKGSLAYQNEEIFLLNAELHYLVPDLPKSDWVLEYTTAFLVNESQVTQGRLFITQKRVVFYSNIFECITQIQVNFSQIQSVSSNQGKFETLVQIELESEEISFKIPLQKTSSILYALNHLIEMTANGTILKTQEIWDSFLSISNDKKNQKVIKQVPSDSVSKRLIERDAYILPTGLTAPIEKMKCSCKDHLETMELDKIVPLPAIMLFDLVFGSQSLDFWKIVDANENGSERQQSSWSESHPSTKNITFITAINNPMVKQKQATVQITSHLLEKSDHFCYVIENHSQVPELPYGDSFKVVTRYCITWVNKNSSRLVIHSGLHWIKNSIMKSIIKATTSKNVSEGIQNFSRILDSQTSNNKTSDSVNKSKKKKKKSSDVLEKSVFSLKTWMNGFKDNLILILSLSLFILCLSNLYTIRIVALKMHLDNNWINDAIPLTPGLYHVKNEFLKLHSNMIMMNGSLVLHEYKNPKRAKVFATLSAHLDKSQKSKTTLLKELEMIDSLQETIWKTLYDNYILEKYSFE